MNQVGISSSTVAKMTNGELVSMKVLEKSARNWIVILEILFIIRKMVDSNGIQCRTYFKIVLAAGVQKDSWLYSGWI